MNLTELEKVDFVRGRVAMTFLPGEHNDYTVHIGHARSLYLGYLVCQRLGIPYHVRLDVGRNDCTAQGADISGAIADLVRCLNFLNIRYILYWQEQEVLSLEMITHKLGGNAKNFGVLVNQSHPELPFGHIYLASLIDDIITYHPSLIIRGVEFERPEEYFATDDPNTPWAQMEIENLAYLLAGRERHIWTLPLIILDGRKLSKTRGLLVHWSILTSMATEIAQQFLLATSICPSEPLSIMDNNLDIDQIGLEPYPWQWNHWTEIIKNYG